MQTVITAAECISGPNRITDPAVFVEDGRITRITSRTDAALPPNTKHIDYPGATLLPAFVDVHIHGSVGHDVMEGTPSAISTIGKFLATRGVGAWLATTVTTSIDRTLTSLEKLATAIEKNTAPGQARPLGIHLEGPFISHKKRGVHPPAEIQPRR